MSSDILIKHHQYGLRIFGACSESARLPGFYSLIGLMVFCLIFAIWDITAVLNNLDILVDDLISALGILSGICNSLAFRLNRRKLKQLIDEVYADRMAGNVSESCRKLMESNIKTSRSLSHSILVLYSLMSVSFLLKAVVSYLADDVDKREFVSPSTFPWDGRQTPIYEVTIFGQFIMSSAVFGSVAVIEGQLAFLVLHACSKGNIVKEEIAELSQHPRQRNVDNEKSLQVAIERLVQRHSEFLTFSKDLQNVFSFISFVHITGLTLLLVVTGFMLIDATEKRAPVRAINYAVFLFAFLLNSGFYCYAGEYLKNQSEEITMEISKCPWYEFPLKQKKEFHFILMRAQIPVILTAGKFNQLSFVLLSSMMKTSYSFLSLVRAAR